MYHFFEVDCFIDRCLKFKHRLEAVMVLYKMEYRDVQEKVKQLKISSFFTNYSVSHSAMNCASLNHLDTFQLKHQCHSSQQNTNLFMSVNH